MLTPELIVLLTLFGSLTLFVTDALRYDVVAILVVVVLAATHCLTPSEAFAGFSSPAIILIACMYVFGHAFTRWGVGEAIGQKVLVRDGISEAGLTFRVTLLAGLLSSVLSNTGVVATLIPVLSSVGRRCKIPVSRLLIPLSFGSLVGGMLSLIGTSTNIAINEVIREHDPSQVFGLFEFTPYGLTLLVVVCLYFLGPGRMLLPRSRMQESLSQHYQVPKFVTEVLVEPNSTLINRLVADTDFAGRYDISVLGIVRKDGGEGILAPGPYNRIRRDDTLIIQGDPDGILRLRQDLGLRQLESVQMGDTRLDSSDVQLVEAVVPAASQLVGATLQETDLRASTGVNVMAISRHGDVRPTRVNRTRFQVGDTLLIQGHHRDIDRVRLSRQLLVLGELAVPNIGHRALMTIGILLGVLGLGSLTSLPLSVAALMGVCALVMTRTVKADEAIRNVDWSVLILTGGMLALGTAFERHGLGRRCAELLSEAGGGLAQPQLLIAFLLISTTLLTQVLNNVSTAVIMTPIALSLAENLGIDGRPLLMAVLTGASLAFMSPVAHQANAMVMGPGDYKFRDYITVGTPLTLILAVTASFLLPLWWPI